MHLFTESTQTIKILNYSSKWTAFPWAPLRLFQNQPSFRESVKRTETRPFSSYCPPLLSVSVTSLSAELVKRARNQNDLGINSFSLTTKFNQKPMRGQVASHAIMCRRVALVLIQGSDHFAISPISMNKQEKEQSSAKLLKLYECIKDVKGTPVISHPGRAAINGTHRQSRCSAPKRISELRAMPRKGGVSKF